MLGSSQRSSPPEYERSIYMERRYLDPDGVRTQNFMHDESFMLEQERKHMMTKIDQKLINDLKKLRGQNLRE